MALSRRPSKERRVTVPEGSRNYRRTKDGQEYEYVKRRGGGHTPIPVGPDGYVPVEALRQRNDVRDPKARMLDGMQTARTVRPQQLTPSEALPWWNRPGRSDIVGIDAPSDAQVTWKRKERKPTKAGKKTAEAEPAPEKPRKAIDIIMEDLQKDETFVQPPQVVNGRWYYPINEELAKRGLESYSWSSYQPGSSTESYRRTVNQVYDMAEQAKRTARPALHGEIDSLARRFAEEYGKWVNTKNSIDASNVSPMIAGPARYNYKKRDRQTSRMEKHYDEYHRIMAIPDKIKELGRPDRNVSIREAGAVESIDDQIAKAEAEQERMKAANAYWRKHKTLVGCPAIPEKVQEYATQKMMEGGRMGQDRPYPDFELTSNREKIKRLKAKREQIATAKQAGSSSTEYGDITVEQDADDMRIRVYFPDKPEEDVRRVMKSNGFRWAPSVGAWQRDLSQSGLASLDRAMNEIARIAGEEYGMTGTSTANRKSKTGGWTRTGVGRWVMQTPDTVFTLAHTKGNRRSPETWDVMAESRRGTTRMSFPSRENAEYYVEQMMRKGGGRR